MTKEELVILKYKVQQCKNESGNCNSLIEQLEEDVINYLLFSDDGLSQLIDENKTLLVSDNFTANVYKEDSYPFGTHAIQLSGDVHTNGFIYITTDKIESPFSNVLATKQFPTNFKGHIQWNGKILIKATKRKWQFLGSRVPERFKGSISENGDIEMSIVKSRFNWFGEDYMNNLILDPFNGDNAKRKKFVDNIVQVKKIVDDYINYELI
jgi:hypothetical protein